MKPLAYLFQPRHGLATGRALFLDQARATDYAATHDGELVPLGPMDPEKWAALWQEYRQAVEARHKMQREQEMLMRSIREALTLAQPGSTIAIKLQSMITTFTS